MHAKSIIKRLLRINKMVIEDLRFEPYGEEEIIVISVRPMSRSTNICPKCGKRCPGYDSSNKLRRWRSLDLATTRVFIEAFAPRITCPEHGVITAKVPWARHDSDYTYDFEMAVTWSTLHATSKDVSEYYRVNWHTVGSIARRVQESLEADNPNSFDDLVDIGIDETSYKKGHKYMTVIVDHTTGSLIWAKKGYGKEVLTSFFEGLTLEQRKNIKHVTADGARFISDCISEYCPQATRCIDTFHVVAWANDALDEVRKTAVRQAKIDASEGKKAERSKKKENLSIPKYVLLKNPENLTSNQRAHMEMMVKSNPKMYRAYLMKEGLRTIFKLSYDEANIEIKRWLNWAQRCRITEFVELGEKIKRHRESILATIKYRLTNARIEAINNKIKVTIRMGYGYRNIDNMIALLMLKCGDYEVVLPGRKAG